MIITKPRNDEDARWIHRETARRECRICPGCGGTNILEDSEHTYVMEKHFFYELDADKTNYKCMECGCQFRSDPYNYSSTYPDFLVSASAIVSMIAVLVDVVCFCMTSKPWGVIGVTSTILLLGVIYIILGMNLYKRHNHYYKYTPVEVHRILSEQEISEIREHKPADENLKLSDMFIRNTLDRNSPLHKLLTNISPLIYQGKFTPNWEYYVGDIILRDNFFYICKEGHKAPEFDVLKWEIMGTKADCVISAHPPKIYNHL